MPRMNVDERAARGSPKRDKMILDVIREVHRYHAGRQEHFTVLKDNQRQLMYETSTNAVAEVLSQVEKLMKRAAR